MNFGIGDLVNVPVEFMFSTPKTGDIGFIESISQDGGLYYPTRYTIRLINGNKINFSVNEIIACKLIAKANTGESNARKL